METTTFTIPDPNGGAASRAYTFSLIMGSSTNANQALLHVTFPGCNPPGYTTYTLLLDQVKEMQNYDSHRIRIDGTLELKQGPNNSRIVVFDGTAHSNSWMQTTCIVSAYS